MPRPGAFVLSPDTQIGLAAGAGAEAAAVSHYLADLFRRATGLPLPLVEEANGDARSRICLGIDPNISAPEGYRLSVSPAAIELVASTAQGLFYGVQTLRQLAPVEVEARQPVAGVTWQVPAVEIEDAPRFPYRGMLLDVGRHWFPVSFIKKFIDLLAAYKLNTFHWHLTEDQGWRIEIKKYPRLTTVGAWRRETQIGYGEGGAPIFDGQPYGGFYTQAEVREVVAYAAARYVTVMPEIDVPGHVTAALAAYPELASTPGPFEVGTRWGVYDTVMCPSEATFAFTEDVLAEVLELFPSRYIHAGGDEVVMRAWQASPGVQALMAREGMTRVEEVHAYFMRRVGSFLAAHGRQMVTWDDVLESGQVPEATIMSWRERGGDVKAARQGQAVIAAPFQFTYFDHYQGPPEADEPPALVPELPIEKVYAFEPVPEGLSPEESQHILGAQGNVWTEWPRAPEQAEYAALPRMLALAEVAWSPKAARQWDGFARRLPAHFERLALWPAHHGRHFYRVRQEHTLDGDGRYWVCLRGNTDDPIHYTLDGTAPDGNSPRYAGPILLTGATTVKAVAVRDGQPIARPAVWRYHVSLATGRSVHFVVAEGDTYPVGLEHALTTGLRGTYTRIWWGNKDLDAVIDLGAPQVVRRLEVGFAVDRLGWVRFPRCVEVLRSEDGVNYTVAAVAPLPEDGSPGSLNREVRLDFEPASTRFIRVRAANYGPLPETHTGAGQRAGLWVDGIVVE